MSKTKLLFDAKSYSYNSCVMCKPTENVKYNAFRTAIVPFISINHIVLVYGRPATRQIIFTLIEQPEHIIAKALYIDQPFS